LAAIGMSSTPFVVNDVREATHHPPKT
jgi:hypothetical protein